MAKQKDIEVQVMEVVQGVADFYVLGRTPLILNRLSDKAMRELLMPDRSNKKKSGKVKHDVLSEYRNASVNLDDDADTLLALPSVAFKGAMMTASLDIPDISKASIGRMVQIEGEYTGIFGKPELLMSMVRSAGMNKTPDVRTRIIIRKWAARISVSYIKPQLGDRAIANLLAAAGMTAGVGDFRPEKGKGKCGQFVLASADDKEFAERVKHGRESQLSAMSSPEPYDDLTANLLAWYLEEADRRELNVARPE